MWISATAADEAVLDTPYLQVSSQNTCQKLMLEDFLLYFLTITDVEGTLYPQIDIWFLKNEYDDFSSVVRERRAKMTCSLLV